MLETILTLPFLSFKLFNFFKISLSILDQESELLLIDVKNEGYNSFDYSVLDSLDKRVPKILFGGVRPEKAIKTGDLKMVESKFLSNKIDIKNR